MDKTTERVLIFAGVVLFLREYAPSMTSAIGLPPTPSLPLNAGTGLTVNQLSQIPTTATTLTQAQANQVITQQIAQQNQDINVIGGLVTSGAGVGIAALIQAGAITGPVGAAIGAAIGAVILLVKTLISDTHLYANQLVQKYENPFAQNFIAVIQAVTDALNAGTLNQSSVIAAYNALYVSWQNYEATMHQLQTTSADWNIVATQSLNNLDNQYLGVTLSNGKTLGAGEGGVYGTTPDYGFVSSWLDWLKSLLSDPQVLVS
jgi:hypothetical protein